MKLTSMVSLFQRSSSHANGRKLHKFKIEWLSILVLFILMRLIISGVAATKTWNESLSPPTWLHSSQWMAFEKTASDQSVMARRFLNGWFRWDTGYFVSISLYGYSAADDSSSFMPLYPFLIRLITLITNGNALFISLIISNLMCIVGLILFYEVALLELGTHLAAWDATLYFAAFPSAFFLFAGYSESLFLVFLLSMWLLLRRGYLLWAAFMASLAGLVRLQGVAVLLPLAWQSLVHISHVNGLTPREEISAILQYIFSRKGQNILNFSKIVQILGIVSLPLFAILLYNFGLEAGGLTTVFGAYSNRLSTVTLPWIALAEFVNRLFTVKLFPADIVDLIVLFVFVGLSIIGISKIRPALTLFSLGVLVMVFSRSSPKGIIQGFMRFALTTFPMFLVMAKLDLKRPIKNLILFIFLITQMFLEWLFINWIWVA